MKISLFGPLFPRPLSKKELAARRQPHHPGFVTTEDIASKRRECHIPKGTTPIRRCHLGHEM